MQDILAALAALSDAAVHATRAFERFMLALPIDDRLRNARVPCTRRARQSRAGALEHHRGTYHAPRETAHEVGSWPAVCTREFRHGGAFYGGSVPPSYPFPVET